MASTWAKFKRAREWICLGQSSSRPGYEIDPPVPLRKLNDHVYEVCKPIGRPSVELVFFHGLQREDTRYQPHLSTWSSRGQEPELWLQWLADKFVGARILTVSYDAALRKTDTQGMVDSFQTSENLMQSLVRSTDGVGRDGCPVVLVGHSLGCLVIKEVLLRANSEVGKRTPGAQSFLDSVRGIFSYSCPHNGANLPNCSQKGPFFNYLAVLNENVARQNQEFETLRQQYGWMTAGVAEGCETRVGTFKGFIVPEASVRHDLDGLLLTISADHFDVCRPVNKQSSGFQKLEEFINTSLQEDRCRQAPKKNLLAYTIGVDADVESITQRLNSGKSLLAIAGMGGIGKTTLANVLFDTIQAKYDYTCFVEDAKINLGKGNSSRNLRQVIAENLMYKGRKVDKKIFDWKILQTEKVLIILDDVDSKSKHDVRFLSQKVSEQSCLITTSRYKLQFLSLHHFEFHEMGTLDPLDAEKLLCFHAFQDEVPPPHIKEWVELLAKKCGNLPLALEVVGAQLYQALDEKLWEGVYKRIEQAKSVEGSTEDSLWSILECSYDALPNDSDEQDMFLDIATIFHGKALKNGEEIWESYLSAGKLTLQNLLNKCLVRLHSDIFGECFISMHELFHDLGRKKANPDADDVTTHTRVFEGRNFKKLLEKEHEYAAVKVLFYSSEWVFPKNPRWTWDMQRWKNLRVVWDKDYGSYNSYEYTMLGAFSSRRPSSIKFPPTLRCARIGWAGYDTVQHLLRVKALRCLIFQSSWVIRRLPVSLWELTELKRLEIDNSAARSTDGQSEEEYEEDSMSFGERSDSHGLSALVRLETLKLKVKSVPLIIEWPKSLRQLSTLSQLEIDGFDSLTELPESLGELLALSRLEILSCCRLTKLPNSVGQLSALRWLKISECGCITELPESIGQLRNLEQLKIVRLGLKKLPESIGQLRRLEQLQLEGDDELETLPESVGQLESLKHLTIISCFKLEGLPESVGQLHSLKHLTIEGCPGIAVSASLGRLWLGSWESLEDLEIRLGSFSNLGFIDQARALQHLTLEHVGPPELPISVGQSGTGIVKRLTISMCNQREIAVLPISLEYLEIRSCKNLRKLPDSIGKLSRLRKLEIFDCEKLGNWRPSSAHVGSNLQVLEFFEYSTVTRWETTFLREDLLELARKGRSLREHKFKATAGDSPSSGLPPFLSEEIFYDVPMYSKGDQNVFY